MWIQRICADALYLSYDQHKSFVLQTRKAECEKAWELTAESAEHAEEGIRSLNSAISAVSAVKKARAGETPALLFDIVI